MIFLQAIVFADNLWLTMTDAELCFGSRSSEDFTPGIGVITGAQNAIVKPLSLLWIILLRSGY